MAAKFFTGLPLDGPDPECVMGYGADALLARGKQARPVNALDHSHNTQRAARRSPVPITIGPRPTSSPATAPVSPCQQNPVAGLA
jgi:hypothetical protein